MLVLFINILVITLLYTGAFVIKRVMICKSEKSIMHNLKYK